MPPLYVTEQGSRLRIADRRLEVEKDEAALVSLPLHHVSEIVLLGNIGLTTPAIGQLLQEGIPVMFLSRRGEYRGQLVGASTPHVALRRKQYACTGEPGFCLAMAKAFVEAKVTHLRVLLRRRAGAAGEASIAAAVAALDRFLIRIPRATRLTSLGGLEGAATAAYFSAYRTLFGAEWAFTRRARRPPPDPVNLMLSFGYTLLAGAARSAVEATGLDPFAGFLHQVEYNRPSLGLDLMEEFRPVIDGLVLWACGSGAVRPDDFEAGAGDRPIEMLDDARRAFLQAYEDRMERTFTHPVAGGKLSLRRCLLEQARQIARSVQEGRPEFVSMGFR